MKLDDITIAHYQILAGKLVREYLPFYTDLLDNYSITERGIGQVIRDQLKLIQDTLPLFARISGRGHTPITKKELQKLDDSVMEIIDTQKEVNDLIQISSDFRSQAEESAARAGISLKDLKFAKTSSGIDLFLYLAVYGGGYSMCRFHFQPLLSFSV